MQNDFNPKDFNSVDNVKPDFDVDYRKSITNQNEGQTQQSQHQSRRHGFGFYALIFVIAWFLTSMQLAVAITAGVALYYYHKGQD